LRRRQRGYLYEIPAILLVLLLVLALTLPGLSAAGRRMVLGLTTVPILYCCVYVGTRPGWTSSGADAGRRRRRFGWFLAGAAAILALVAALVLR
jgi:hypothetical protein